GDRKSASSIPSFRVGKNALYLGRKRKDQIVIPPGADDLQRVTQAFRGVLGGQSHGAKVEIIDNTSQIAKRHGTLDDFVQTWRQNRRSREKKSIEAGHRVQHLGTALIANAPFPFVIV